MRRINENVALAKSILNKSGITPDSPFWSDYLKIREICGQNNGYVGILTKIRFVDLVTDMDEIESIFNILKNSKIDINKLNRMSYSDIQDIFYDEFTSEKSDKTDIELVFKDSQYSYYRVYTYKGILKIGSPSWCLKTKSNWDSYQKSYPQQWVAVDNRYKKGLLSPDNNYLSSYSNTGKPWIRYGVSLRDNGDGTLAWTGNNDNNGSVSIDPDSWTFYGVINTILNLVAGIKKSYYDSFVGCEKVNERWHKVVNRGLFFKRMNLLNDVVDEKSEVYVTFSESYSFLPMILVLNTYNFHIIFPTNKSYPVENAFNKPIDISGKTIKQVIFDYISDKDDIYFDGIKLKNKMTTIEEIKSNSQFIDQCGKWLIFDRNKNYYLIVNTDVDVIEVPTTTLSKKWNDNMENPMAWYLKKENLTPYGEGSVSSFLNLKDYHKEVISFMKNKLKKQDLPDTKPEEGGESESTEKPRVKRFWDFLKKR